MTGASNQLISVSPDELKFQFELDKQSFCDLKVSNTTEHNVAFKVKTTSPKKYFVRPNTGVIQPWDSCYIRVTLQAQREFPADMQCKDKFLLQSTIVGSYSDDLPPDTFNKDNGKTVVEECKLKVLYVTPNSTTGNSEDGSKQGSDANSMVQRTREERDAAVRQTQQLQQELDMLKRRRNRKNDLGFSLKFALLVGVIGFTVGILFKLLSSPTAE
ncbi:PREDICTED: vesicle-associated protein 2-1 isoform X2 [Ipomoea nil]|uniref:vesicle-associated protein 2-1 isoform X2 n=1 Tax=Ipomoea nil TaxID=35883 RepID=UPI000901B3CA|nr:PREDICTED: vesicle-associated protein 2-1 isoform X2 [Ipomoea nil]